MTALPAHRPAALAEIVWPPTQPELWLETVACLDDHVDRERLLRDEDAPEPPYWAHLWPAATVLAGALRESGGALAGRRVIEVGCGLGLPGLVAATLGAQVVLTDRDGDAVAFARRNAVRNRLGCSVIQMDWQTSAIRGQFDLCLAADVTYNPSANGALIAFLDRHLTRTGEVWIAESVRAEEPALPGLLRQRMDFSEERVAEVEDGHRVWVRLLRARWRL